MALSTGQTEGYIVSTQVANLTRSDTQLRDITKVKVVSSTYTMNDGKIYLYASNDGGENYIMIKDNGHTWNLNYGNEAKADPQSAQTEYNDLRIKIRFTRPSASDTSPDISMLKIRYNNVPDVARRTV